MLLSSVRTERTLVVKFPLSIRALGALLRILLMANHLRQGGEHFVLPPIGLSNWCKRLAARIALTNSSRPILTLLPSSKLGGEPEPNDRECSRQLLPPSGPARTEGLSAKGVSFHSRPTD